VPGTGMLEGLAVSDRGVLYATSYRQVNADGSAGGIRRCLDPASAGAGFENVTSGLEAGATLWGLSIKGDRLWSIDTTNNRIMTYIDRLAEPVTLISPENGAEQVGQTGSGKFVVADLEWESLAGATGYILQVDDNPDFSSLVNKSQGTTSLSTMRLSNLKLDTAYFWRVKAGGPVSGPWSETWSFLPPRAAAPVWVPRD